ncbi:hypothetical protein TWF696_005031 [Orbilia brochopaga]|uniref:Uncharacterized protein n=1 Tax=Orbilia brochopaga TaxID=3140254 RepID=A0AAV9V0E8_9PEZI
MLTSSKDILDAWKEEASRCGKIGKLTGGVALGACAFAGTALMSGRPFMSVAVLAPLCIAVVTAFVGYFVFWRSCGAADQEAKKLKESSTQFEALWRVARDLLIYLGYVCYGSGLDSIDKTASPEEWNELKKLCDKYKISGDVQTDSTEYQAIIDSTKKVIRDYLDNMKEDKTFQRFFKDV